MYLSHFCFTLVETFEFDLNMVMVQYVIVVFFVNSFHIDLCVKVVLFNINQIIILSTLKGFLKQNVFI